MNHFKKQYHHHATDHFEDKIVTQSGMFENKVGP